MLVVESRNTLPSFTGLGTFSAGVHDTCSHHRVELSLHGKMELVWCERLALLTDPDALCSR
jgi:hypothetical protein